jgi:hypothetical protein
MSPLLARRARILILGLAWGLVCASAGAANRPPRLTDLHTIGSPAAVGSSEPAMTVAPDGSVYMCWFERPDSARVVLRLSRFVKESWLEAITVAEGDSFEVNWANVPAIVALGGDKLMIGWSWKTGEGEASDVRISGSTDGGESWAPPVVPHRDRTATEHGFVSLVPAERGGARAFWLDGRKYASRAPADSANAHGGETALRTAWVGLDGSLSDEDEVDDRVCDCCPTAAVGRGARALVVYRDRRGRDERDISVAWLEAGTWSEPAPVGNDGWRIDGCPVNGPALDRAGTRLGVAWFTMARDSAAVKLAFSDDLGHSFGRSLRLDGGDPLGRVALVLLDDGSALAGWLESRGAEGFFQIRGVGREGDLGDPVTAARLTPTHASGIPRMVRSGERLFLAWTETGEHPRIRTAIARIVR